ncbi:hypothetical protein Ahy_B08g092146 [Arachis hypogaea]|uniref:Protein kinase domain-containing protein n=1 Tax=Arachis hypogaea TaxID=3818 RepID=A0A444Y3A7_ARAHY|nr:hypothetical protein Ahy_B08g092146 [Arachis hypogaea]
MGIEAEEQAEYSKKLQGYDHQHGHSHSHTLKHKLNPLVLVIVTNLVNIYIVTGPFSSLYHHPPHHNNNFNSILQELNATKSQLAASHSLLSELHRRLDSTNLLVQALFIDLTTRQQDKQYSRNNNGERSSNEELNLALASYKLPFEYSQWIGSEEIHSPIGAVCLRFQDELNQYMSYDIGGECLADEVFAQMLVSKGCEPLPKRRCHPKSPKDFVEPNQDLQDSLWEIPPDSNIVWDPYTCKSHKCLIERKNNKGDICCKDERKECDNHHKHTGFGQSIQPLHCITSRGLIPIHLSISQRLPFFENTLDIVHSMEFIGNWLPETMLEFLLYDVYRVLRPGGIFWLEHFFCFGSQVNGTYLPMFDLGSTDLDGTLVESLILMGFRRMNVGFCFEEGEQMLVYEFVPNGTLKDTITGKSGIRFGWHRRIKVALGAARGFAYLHEHADPPIIHTDIKSNNILLDEKLDAKGYLDPEYYISQQLTEKSDVYRFGVLMLELITRRKPIERGKYIVKVVRNSIDKTKDMYGLHELIDRAIRDGLALNGFDKFVDLAMMCLEESGAERPPMSDVVKEIEIILHSIGLDPAAESEPSTSSSFQHNEVSLESFHQPYSSGSLYSSSEYIQKKNNEHEPR